MDTGHRFTALCHQGHAEARLNGETEHGRVPVPRRRREGEPAQQADQHYLELNHRQVLPDAGPGPVPERHVHACRPARRGHTVGEPVRMELAGVGAQTPLSWCSIDLIKALSKASSIV